MGYIGRGPVKSGAFRIIDDIASGFDGSDVTFTLQSSSSNITPGTEQNLLIAVDGVMQEPIDAFTISGSVLTFTSAPASGASFWGVELGDVGGIAANVANGAVDTAQLAADAVDGTKIADDVINSEHYVAASIDNEHLANDAVGADELAANAVVNASVASGAAIAFSKMENLTASRLLVSDGSGDVSVSAVTAAEMLQLDGISANVTDTNLNILTDSSSTTALHLHAGAALSSKVGQLTRDTATATGTQAVTGVGFQPKAVIFNGAKNGTESVVYCSFTDGTYDGQTYSREEETAGNRTSNDGLLQFHQSGSGNYNSGGLTLDSDGFTINWTKAGTNSGTITLQYLAIR